MFRVDLGVQTSEKRPLERKAKKLSETPAGCSPDPGGRKRQTWWRRIQDHRADDDDDLGDLFQYVR